MAAMTSQGVTTSTVRWIFGCLPEWERTEPSGLDLFASWTCIVSTAHGLRILYWASRSRSTRSSGRTRRLRGTVNPECVHARSIWARAGGSRPFWGQKREEPRPEQLLQRREADVGQDGEQAGAHEQAVGHQRVQVGMDVPVLAEGVDGHDDAGQAVRQAQGCLPVVAQALMSEAADVLEHVAGDGLPGISPDHA